MPHVIRRQYQWRMSMLLVWQENYSSYFPGLEYRRRFWPTKVPILPPSFLYELYRMLHVQPIRTTPYHPQTDGLVNRTLKMMLKKATVKEGDTLLLYLLFAYHEVPQASKGFSLFELLYGRQVRGPLDVLNETWQVPRECDLSHSLNSRKDEEN